MSVILTLLKEVLLPIGVTVITVRYKFNKKTKLENLEYQKDVASDISNLYYENILDNSEVTVDTVKNSLRRIDRYSFKFKRHRLDQTFCDTVESIITCGARITDAESAIKEDIRIRAKIEKLIEG